MDSAHSSSLASAPERVQVVSELGEVECDYEALIYRFFRPYAAMCQNLIVNHTRGSDHKAQWWAN
jgi:hypothetical protein